jgi:hypothetical protein
MGYYKKLKTNILIDNIKKYYFSYVGIGNIPHIKKRDYGGEDSYQICDK